MIFKLPCSEIQFTANIFYHLLWDSINNKRSKSDNARRICTTFTQTHLFCDLNTLINTSCGNLGDNAYFYGQKACQNVASKFRYGKVTNKRSEIYLLNRNKYTDEFDKQVKENYQAAYTKAAEFAHRYFGIKGSSKNDILVQKILYLILNDDSINEAQDFYICSDGSTKTKAELRSIDTVEFEAFLLGVWHYLIVSQKLQADLSKRKEISVNTDYSHIKIHLIYDVLKKTQAEGTSSANGDDAEKSNDSNYSTDSDADKEEEKNATKDQNKYIISDPEKAKKIKEAVKKCIASEFDLPVDFERDINIISVLENNNIRLSRGIFFYLLTHSIQTVHPKRNKNAVERLFLDFLNLTADNSCCIDFSQSHVRDHYDKFGYLKALCSADCLDDETLINDFSDRLHTNYDEALSNMIKIRKKYFNSDYWNEVLVVALIEFIRNDDSIDDSQEFLVCSNGDFLTKAQLCELEEIEFESFLLGVWHYVVSQLDTQDSADEHTFDTVFKLSYKSNGKKCTRYRSGEIIEEQSDLYVELTYLEDSLKK